MVLYCNLLVQLWPTGAIEHSLFVDFMLGVPLTVDDLHATIVRLQATLE